MSLIDKRRLVLEVLAMRDRWGNCSTLRVNGDKTWWDCKLKLENNIFDVQIIYPKDYPYVPPDIKIINPPLITGTPHVLNYGEFICWNWNHSDHNRNIWNSTKDTAALCVGVAYRWLTAYLVWRTLGTWPVPDAKKV